MKTYENVRRVGIGQQQEFNGAVLKALKSVLEEIMPDVAQGWIENPESLKRVLRSALLPLSKNPVKNNYTKSIDTSLRFGTLP